MDSKGARKMEEMDMTASSLGLISVASALLSLPWAAPLHALDKEKTLISVS